MFVTLLVTALIRYYKRVWTTKTDKGVVEHRKQEKAQLIVLLIRGAAAIMLYSFNILVYQSLSTVACERAGDEIHMLQDPDQV